MTPFWTALVEHDVLEPWIGDPGFVVVDCRFSLADTESGRQAYSTGHIPGARYAHLDDDLSGPVLPGKTGRHPLPSPETLGKTLSNWGISNTTQVVCYDDAGGAIAARLWWMLNWLGHNRVAVLNGGWPLWTQAGLPVDDAVPTPLPASFIVSVQKRLLVSAEQLERRMADRTATIFDVRDHTRYTGENETIDPVAGHIRGALSLPFKNNLMPDGRFFAADRLKDIYRSAGINVAELDAADCGAAETSGLATNATDHPVIFYCGSGVTAAHQVLAMHYANLGMAQLYPGSWSEWILDPKRAISTGDS